ncbi:RICIN domain-containing protein [Catellatospora sp. NPDC049133]|uniref:RICIN domain-containing protein n=1 Tax=Catellatospora sp. NPDC049133 TaxID=3155499 RepID=UPI0033F1B730
MPTDTPTDDLTQPRRRKRISTIVRRAAALTMSVLAAITMNGIMAAPAQAELPWDSFPASWNRVMLFAGSSLPANNARSLVFDVDNSGGHGWGILLFPSHAATNEIWVIEPAVEGGYYYHPAYNRNLCMDFDGERAVGALLKVNACDGSASQRWHSRSYNGGRQIATHSDWQYCIDVPNSNFNSMQQLQLWNCNGTMAQNFTYNGCYNYTCDGRWPDVMGCDKGNPYQSTTLYTDSYGTAQARMVISQTCSAAWGVIYHDAAAQSVNLVRNSRLNYSGPTTYFEKIGERGKHIWTYMFGLAGGLHVVCLRNGANGDEACTAIY